MQHSVRVSHHGGPWWTMVDHGGPWWTMVDHGGPWRSGDGDDVGIFNMLFSRSKANPITVFHSRT
jgi:hypothetical protein